MSLSNYQLILLDNLIYLDSITLNTVGNRNIGYVIDLLRYENSDPSNSIGSGAAQSAVQELIITSIVRQIICSMTRFRSVAARSGT
ncbi:MAG: hypothetical protein K2G89_11505 [Lachnospiraceae bacterium]|nr:hypothetical protein [Lachnospiraceae bacterium]